MTVRTPASVCCVLEQETLFALHQSTQLQVPCGDNLVRGVLCYELFGGIAPKNNTFFTEHDRLHATELHKHPCTTYVL